eukprot:362917-Chlamydomonas_euryale.AAC.12
MFVRYGTLRYGIRFHLRACERRVPAALWRVRVVQLGEKVGVERARAAAARSVAGQPAVRAVEDDDLSVWQQRCIGHHAWSPHVLALPAKTKVVVGRELAGQVDRQANRLGARDCVEVGVGVLALATKHHDLHEVVVLRAQSKHHAGAW